MSIKERAEVLTAKVAMGLPDRVIRALAGRPIVLDGQTLAPDTQLMLRMAPLTGPAAETLPIPQGRVAIDKQSRTIGGEHVVGVVRSLEVPGAAGPRPARLYSPTRTGSDDTLPLLVFFHGGGFMYGGLDSHDAPCRLLCERAGVRVLSVSYRLAPEHAFPAAHDDAWAAFTWVSEHAAELGADPDRLAVGGDSAGGNLAAATAIRAAVEGVPLAFQLLVYPATDTLRDTRSYDLFKQGFFLTEQFMQLATDSYVPDRGDHDDPRISPIYADVPGGLAPAYIATAGFDPLRDEGEAYARKLVDAGVEVELKRFPDQIHGFFNVVGVGRRSPAYVTEIADRLRVALAG